MAAYPHIYLDLRWMIPGYTGGIETTARCVLETLLKLDTRHTFTVLLPCVTRYDFDLRERPNFHLVTSDGPGYYLARSLELLRQKFHRGRMPGVWVRARQTDAQASISLAGAIAPDLYSLKNLLVINDLQHEYYPQFFHPRELDNLRQDVQAALAHANCVLTISEFTRQTLAERRLAAASQVHVAPLGVSTRFQPIQAESAAASARIIGKYHLTPGSYLFYPANTWPHKNHRLILQALHLLKQKGEKVERLPSLVCTGAPKEAHPDLLELVQQYELRDHFHFLGYCPESDLPALYQHAIALVFPSMFEGFGMPVLEAMRCGCPVICSTAASLPEVAGEAALYFNPGDAAALADALREILTRPHLRSQLIEHGFKQSRPYTWERFVRTLLAEVDQMVTGQVMELVEPVSPSRRSLIRQALWRMNRTGRSRQWLSESQELTKQKCIRPATVKILQASVLAPEVLFNLVIFPWMRDRLLRKLAARLTRKPGSARQ